MLVFQNKEMAALMVYQTNPSGIEQYFTQILSFVSVIQYGCWSREWKRSILCTVGTVWAWTKDKLSTPHYIAKNGVHLISVFLHNLQIAVIDYNFMYPSIKVTKWILQYLCSKWWPQGGTCDGILDAWMSCDKILQWTSPTVLFCIVM